VSFGSDLISPYTRKDKENPSTILLKNAVDNDRLLEIARGNVNHGFVNDTEFKNFNQLKSISSIEAPNNTNAQAIKSSKKSKKNRVNMVKQQDDQQQPHQHSRDSNNDKTYEDEYDVANKAIKKSNPNLELIDSINKELKRVTTGYKPDTSNA
jgi:hypothetical protein